MTRGPKPIPAFIRFQRYVEKTEHCWQWAGATQAGGYGRFCAGGRGNLILAHRWSYEHFRGPIAAGMTIDHLCLNTSCVNPDHMEVVTREVNARRGNPNTDKTHCKHGHELTPDNVYVPPGRPTTRDCRTCRRARQRGVMPEADALPRAG